MFVLDGFLYLIVTKHKLTVYPYKLELRKKTRRRISHAWASLSIFLIEFAFDWKGTFSKE
jgi:hypothetical protein